MAPARHLNLALHSPAPLCSAAIRTITYTCHSAQLSLSQPAHTCCPLLKSALLSHSLLDCFTQSLLLHFPALTLGLLSCCRPSVDVTHPLRLILTYHLSLWCLTMSFAFVPLSNSSPASTTLCVLTCFLVLKDFHVITCTASVTLPVGFRDVFI